MALYLWRASANSYANRKWKFRVRIKKGEIDSVRQV